MRTVQELLSETLPCTRAPVLNFELGQVSLGSTEDVQLIPAVSYLVT